MNTFKTALLLTGLTLLLVVGGGAIAGERGMTFALVGAIVMNGIAYFFSDKIALSMSGAQPVTREQAPRLYSITERLCGQVGLPMPKLYVIPEAAPNAFATGRSPKHASVAVTAGLLELMNEQEVEGVLAHELGHVQNYDILIASVAATLAGAITWVAHMGRWAMIFAGGRSDARNGGGLGALLMLFLAPIAAVLVQLAISRQREYAADATAARTVGHPFGLVSALEKLGAYNKRIPMERRPRHHFPLHRGSARRRADVLQAVQHAPAARRTHAALRNMVVTR